MGAGRQSRRAGHTEFSGGRDRGGGAYLCRHHRTQRGGGPARQGPDHAA